MEDLKKKTYSECSDMTRSSQSNFCSGSVLRTSDSNGNSLFIESAHDETDDCLKEKTCYLFQPVISPTAGFSNRNLILTIVYLGPR